MIYIVYRYKIEPKKSSIGCFPLLVRIERLLLLMSINIAKLITTITRTSTIGIMIGANDLKKKERKKKTKCYKFNFKKSKCLSKTLDIIALISKIIIVCEI